MRDSNFDVNNIVRSVRTVERYVRDELAISFLHPHDAVILSQVIFVKVVSDVTNTIGQLFKPVANTRGVKAYSEWNPVVSAFLKGFNKRLFA